MGLFDAISPILGYVLAIGIVLILATLPFMIPASTYLEDAAVTMSQILVVVALLVGISVAAKLGKEI